MRFQRKAALSMTILATTMTGCGALPEGVLDLLGPIVVEAVRETVQSSIEDVLSENVGALLDDQLPLDIPIEPQI